jgi:UDP-N-acetylglucosamine transferase subunit ALG13
LILVSLGTHEQPFARMLDLVEPLAVENKLVVQHGHTPARADAPGIRWLPFASYDEMNELMREADAVICHAGVGTIVTALSLGVTPVVVPRLRRFNEHIDDHQLQITGAFAASNLAVGYEQGTDLRAAIERARRMPPRTQNGGRELKRAVRQAAAIG